MSQTGMSPVAAIAAVPIIVGFWGLLASGVLYFLARGLGARAVWTWPVVVFLLAAGLVGLQADAFATPVKRFATIAFPLVLTATWGVPPAWAVYRLTRRNPQAAFGRYYARAVIPLFISTSILVAFTYWVLKHG